MREEGVRYNCGERGVKGVREREEAIREMVMDDIGWYSVDIGGVIQR